MWWNKSRHKIEYMEVEDSLQLEQSRFDPCSSEEEIEVVEEEKEEEIIEDIDYYDDAPHFCREYIEEIYHYLKEKEVLIFYSFSLIQP